MQVKVALRRQPINFLLEAWFFILLMRDWIQSCSSSSILLLLFFFSFSAVNSSESLIPSVEISTALVNRSAFTDGIEGPCMFGCIRSIVIDNWLLIIGGKRQRDTSRWHWWLSPWTDYVGWQPGRARRTCWRWPVRPVIRIAIGCPTTTGAAVADATLAMESSPTLDHRSLPLPLWRRVDRVEAFEFCPSDERRVRQLRPKLP